MIEDFFHPRAGYQINTLAPAFSAKGYNVIIVSSIIDYFPRNLKDFFGTNRIDHFDREFESRYGVKIIRVKPLFYYSGRIVYKPSIFKLIDSLNPDILYVHGIDTFAGIIFTLRSHRLNYPILFDCHMIEFASKNKLSRIFRFLFRKFVTPVIIRNKIPVIDVSMTGFPNRAYGIPQDLTIQIPLQNVDTSIFKPDENLRSSFRKKFNIPDEAFVIMYAGKIDEEKGGMLLAEAFSQRIISSKREPYIVIVSSNSDSYAMKVKSIISQSGNKVIFLPTQPFELLPELYNAADLFILPKQSSMSFFHCQACGVPVLFEENSVNASRLWNKNALTFRPGDADDLRTKIITMLEMDDAEIQKMKINSRDYILKNYDFNTIISKYEYAVEIAIMNYKERFSRKRRDR